MMRQLKLGLAIVGVLLLCALSAYIAHTIARPPTVTVFGTAAVLKQVQQLNELVTVKYVIEKVIGRSEKDRSGEDRVLLIAHGVVKAGVRLDELKPEDVQLGHDGAVRLRLPAARILDVYLDEQRTQVYERSTGVLRRIIKGVDKDLEARARDNAVDSIRAAAQEMEIEREARQRAEKDIEQLLIVLGFKKVRFE
jgi:hypothetical protein